MTDGIQNAVQVAAPFIDGATVPSDGGAFVDVIDPSNGRCRLKIPAGHETDVERAVASARRAFDDGRWANERLASRSAVLQRVASLIESEAEALDALDAGEMGKPISEPLFNARAAAALMRFYAEAVDKVTGDTYRSDGNTFVVQRRVPRGVVAAVVPWNFPLYNAVLKVGPALAAGNSVVLKPSELSSRSALRLAHLMSEAGVPPGVLNVVLGLGESVGRALGLHMDVDMIAFTGSTEVGKLMLRNAGLSNLKAVMTECGGKSPQIVFGDGVDLDRASERIARSILLNQGQVCSAGSRVLVQRSVEAELLERIEEYFKRVAIGNALDSATTFGPLASAQQRQRVMRFVEAAKAQDAQLVIGGREALPETGGYFVEPTIFRNVSPSARIAQEEIFGPVLSVISFNDEDEAIRIANGTTYGLTSYVWTTDLSRAMRTAKSIRSSVVINAAPPAGGACPASSSEPTSQSGIGVEGGLAGMESYMRRQRIWINHA